MDSKKNKFWQIPKLLEDSNKDFYIKKQKALIINKTNSLTKIKNFIKTSESYKNKIPPSNLTQKVFVPLENLNHILHKFFRNVSFSSKSISFSSNEQKIFKAILSKKRIKYSNQTSFDQNCLENLSKLFFMKKRETYLKFVIPKCIKFLKNKLIQKLSIHDSTHKKLTRKQRESLFYQHYFGEISKTEQIPIESFFVFKNCTHRFSDLIPRSINQDLIRLWQKNPVLIDEILEYIDGNFLQDVQEFNKDKIEGLVDKWRKMIIDQGEDQAVKKIVKGLRLKKGKLPWTVNEVKHIMEQARRF